MTVRIPPRTVYASAPARTTATGIHGSIRGPGGFLGRRRVALARGAIEQRWAFARLPGGHAAIVAARRARDGWHARLRRVSHPSLGLPPVDRSGGLPPVARRIDTRRDALAARALEVAIDRDPTLRDRFDETGMRQLLRDTATILDRVVEAVAADDPEPARVFAEAVAPVYRRRKVPMDDLINLASSVREAIAAILPVADMAAVEAAVDAMIDRFKWHRRLAGDARKRNRILAAIYKGA